MCTITKTWLVIALGLIALPACGEGCQGSAGRVGLADVGIFVECDRQGYTVHNRGDRDRYVTVSAAACVLNTAQIPPLGPNGELPDIVVHGSGASALPPFAQVVPAGTSRRVAIDLSKVDECLDYTHAPPGQHERGPTSLVSQGPADGLMLHIDATRLGAMRSERNARVVCKW